MDAMLQSRIQNLIGGDMPMNVEQFAEGGDVDKPGPFSNFELDLVEDLEGAEASMVTDEALVPPDRERQSLETAINDLMMARAEAEDEGERQYIDGLIEASEVGAQAPMADLALQLSEAGRGGDVTLAHVRPGEIVLPPESMDDPEFEAAVERRLLELDMDPQAAVVGAGIASLNPITGLEEFGWFKKTWKSVKKVVKKVVKPIAQVAQFIPGPWQVPAAIIAKASTVYDVAKGRANPLMLATVFSPLPGSDAAGQAGKGIGSLSGIKEFVTKGQDGVGFFGNVGKGIASLGTNIADTVGDVTEFFVKGKDNVGFLGNVGKGISSLGDYVFEGDTPGNLFTNVRRDVFGTHTVGQADPDLVSGLRAQGLSEDEISTIIKGMGRSAGDVMTTGTLMGADALGKSLGLPQSVVNIMNQGVYEPDQVLAALKADPTYSTVLSSIEASSAGGKADDILTAFINSGQAGPVASAGAVAQAAEQAAGSGKGDILSSLSQFFGSDIVKQLGPLALSAFLGKMAYDEAKDYTGVPLNSMTTMQYQGGTNLPALSGGRPTPNRSAQPVMGARYGGPVMAFANGGDVAMKDFVEMDGKIAGPGTETSDDIPAMLSDGEFVMTGQAVRGAGAFDMSKGDGGIITLTPNGTEGREKGTELMYEMMDLFAEYADKPKSKRAAA